VTPGFSYGTPDDSAQGCSSDAGRQIAVPTVVLCGELDLPDQLPVCQVMVERIPDARLVTLPGVAQLPHLENDQTCLTATIDFLR
jgi:3-oxoadipate enol-lactonase